MLRGIIRTILGDEACDTGAPGKECPAWCWRCMPESVFRKRMAARGYPQEQIDSRVAEVLAKHAAEVAHRWRLLGATSADRAGSTHPPT